MYGEKQGFTHGDRDPNTMLTVADSVFIPTRSAELVGVAVVPGAETADDVVYLHLKLKGFIRPDTAAVRSLVAALEAANSLPFGDKRTQYVWISLLPPAMAAHAAELVSDDQEAWPTVVDAFVLTPTQFEKDVFWRVRGLFEEQDGAPANEVHLIDRGTNERVHPDRYRRDYPLMEAKRYLVTIQTHSPEAHGVNMQAGSTIAMTSEDDDQALLKLASDPLQIVPNQVASKRFSISTDSAIDTRFTGIHLETQVPDHTSTYPPGSECSLTFSICKDRWRLLFGIILVLLATGITGYIAGAKPDGWTSAVLAVSAALFLAIAGWLLSRQFKIGK